MVARLAVAGKPRGAALTRERHRSRLDPGLAPRAEILAAKVRKALAAHPRCAVPARERFGMNDVTHCGRVEVPALHPGLLPVELVVAPAACVRRAAVPLPPPHQRGEQAR